jgi:hypothetical protein
MNENKRAIPIGNVLRANIRGFVVASRIPEPQVPTFGTFVRAPIQGDQAQLLGLVYDIRLQDDPFLRHLAVAVDESNPQHQAIIADQRERVVPVEISVAAIGYRDDAGAYYHGLPPQPPMILKQIKVCEKEEVRQITEQPNWIAPLLDNQDVPVDALIARALQRSSRLHEAREPYLVEAARYLARYLARDPLRLETILRQLDVE